MRQDEQISRYEVNRKVRMVITRHDGDLTRIDYSFLGKTVYLSGDLVKPERDFTPREIEAIVTDISAIPDVLDIIFDLNNWIIEGSHDSWQIKPIRKTGEIINVSGFSEDTTLIINEAPELNKALEELKNKNTTKEA
jgi:hypothetical protein